MPDPVLSPIEESLKAIGNQINALRVELDDLKSEKGSKARIDELKNEIHLLKTEAAKLQGAARKTPKVPDADSTTPAWDPWDPAGIFDGE